MIYILSGLDTKNKNLYIKSLICNREVIDLRLGISDKNLIMSYSSGESLFGSSFVVIMDNILSDDEINLSTPELNLLMKSDTFFIFKEDKMLALNKKKYEKYAEIKDFNTKNNKEISKFNVFDITDAFEKKDKITSWILYINAINASIEPEAIAGVLFWKIKMMLINGTKVFNKKELKNQSSNIVSIYHKAHRGDCDLVISLEQFILSSLSSK